MTRTLTTDDLNRTVLARQFLLERSHLPLHRVIERMAGVQAQYAPSAYVGLWARVRDFSRADLTSALERRSIVQATVMRGTIHLVSKGDFWPLTEATRPTRQEGWLRTFGKNHDLDRIHDLSRHVEETLADGPRKRRELTDDFGIDSETWGGVTGWVDLVRVPPSGTWDSRRADLYGLASDWIGPSDSNETVGQDLLVRRYLGGFGPATRRDIAAFTLFSLATIDDSLHRLRTRRFRSEDGEDLFDIAGAPVVAAEVAAPVRFIGNWDAVLLVHARRADILPEGHRSRIFHTRAPHSFATFLVDGKVRGTWKEVAGKVVLERFEPLPRRFVRELESERERLEGFLG